MGATLIENSLSPRKEVKKLILGRHFLEYKCENCNNPGQWLGQKLRLHLDHKNGIRNDNRIENLRFLCPNCHDLQPTSHLKKGGSSKRVVKLTVNQILEARKTESNIRGILLKLNVAEASPNYTKVRKILMKFGQEFPSVIKLVGESNGDRPHLRRVERPDKITLANLVQRIPMTQIAQKYKVTDNAIRKWCCRYGIDYRNVSPFCMGM
jgi:hypothetical protein